MKSGEQILNEYERERPEAGEEWLAKGLMLGAELRVDVGVWGVLWAAKIPGGKEYFGVTKARACRKLVRSIVGDIE